MDRNRLLRRKGKRYDGVVLNQEHPQHGWGRYAAKKSRKGFVADWNKPVVFVDANDDPNDGAGHWEFK